MRRIERWRAMKSLRSAFRYHLAYLEWPDSSIPAQKKRLSSMQIDWNPVRRALLVLILVAAAAPSATAQEPGVADRVQDLVAELEKGSVEEAWRTSDDLARLGDRAVPSIEEHLDSTNVAVRLGAARALLALKDV